MSKVTKIVRPSGTIEYRNEEGDLHRDGNKPARIYANGIKAWYKNGKEHRDGDRPAVIWANKVKIWYRDGKRHRDGGLPAVVSANGTKKWYKNGYFYTPKKRNGHYDDRVVDLTDYHYLGSLDEEDLSLLTYSGEFEDRSGNGHGDSYGDGQGSGRWIWESIDISEYDALCARHFEGFSMAI